ncbi:hypothetical protein AB0L00_20390 [Actinoallomurus sp. NPDC052308]|uniref:hypothetical protein n=1 Tax=Actinoallomurus sp. NPDC052308 TaxID=3155530 RepID=UPI00341D2995
MTHNLDKTRTRRGVFLLLYIAMLGLGIVDVWLCPIHWLVTVGWIDLVLIGSLTAFAGFGILVARLVAEAIARAIGAFIEAILRSIFR